MIDKYLKIIKHYGLRHQLKKFNEECYELQEAVLDYEKNKENPFKAITNAISRIVSCITETKKDDNDKKHIIEELADVQNMINQILYYYDIDFELVSEEMESKIDRQLSRIEKELSCDINEN